MDLRKLKAERLRAARKKAGFDSAEAAAEAFGWKAAGYRHHENETRGFGSDAAMKYGRAFKVKPAWLLGMESGPDVPADIREPKLIVDAAVAAGVWRELSWGADRKFEIELPSPFPGVKRFGVLVEGNSMDMVYEPGTVLDCVSIFKNGAKPKTGDHVIVERIRPGLRELTVKEFHEEGGQMMLLPRSSSDEFKPVAYPGPDDEQPPDGETIQIIGFVVAAYPPRTIDLMRRMGIIKQ